MTTVEKAADPFENYRALIAKIDAKVAAITAAQRALVQCKRGCHSCCAPGLTVNAVEREFLAAHIRQTPRLSDALAKLEAANPHSGTRCALLDAAGDCAVYAARPIICRSHGSPVELEDRRRDACPLNFVGTPLGELPGDAVFNLKLLNTLLALINGKFCEDSSASARDSDGARHALTLSGLLSPSP